MDELVVELMNAWDELDGAAQRMLVAQPSQMSEAAQQMNKSRLRMREIVQRLGTNAAKKTQ